jgi:hypothetical protein
LSQSRQTLGTPTLNQYSSAIQHFWLEAALKASLTLAERRTHGSG